MVGSLKEELQGEKNQKMYPKTSFMYVFGIFYPHRRDKFTLTCIFILIREQMMVGPQKDEGSRSVLYGQ